MQTRQNLSGKNSCDFPTSFTTQVNPNLLFFLVFTYKFKKNHKTFSHDDMICCKIFSIKLLSKPIERDK